MRHTEFDRILSAFQARYGKYEGDLQFNKWLGNTKLDEGKPYVWSYSPKRKRNTR